MPFLIAFGVILAILLLVLLFAYVCFRIVFYRPTRKPVPQDEYPIPPGKEYEEYKDVMVNWMKQARVPVRARVHHFL